MKIRLSLVNVFTGSGLFFLYGTVYHLVSNYQYWWLYLFLGMIFMFISILSAGLSLSNKLSQVRSGKFKGKRISPDVFFINGICIRCKESSVLNVQLVCEDCFRIKVAVEQKA